MDRRKKVLIFELDSGSWNILQPLLSQGKLPNLKRLMNEGAYGILHSDSPPISPRIWTTIFTGKNSKKHGVEFFASTSSGVKQKRLWDILNEKGLKVGVFGSLVTWPPYPINGFMIPSIFSLGTETYPDNYGVFQEIALSERKKLHKGEKKKKYLHNLLNIYLKLKAIGVTSETFHSAIRYFISEKVLRFSPKDRYWRKASIYLKMSVDVFTHLYHRFQPDFATFHNHLCDAVSHRYWDCYEPQLFESVAPREIDKYRKVIPDSYILTDKVIGRIISSLDPSTNIIIISDHGSKALPNTIKPYVINFDNFLRILQMQDKVIPARFGFKSLFYFTNGQDKEPLLEAMQSVSLADTGEKIFKVESEEQYISLSPVPPLWRRDIPEETPIRINGYGTYLFKEIFTRQKLKVTGIHHKEGIFIAWGPMIKKGVRAVDAAVFDITPTVLTLMGFPVAKDMDGRVIKEILNEKALLMNPVKYIDTYEDNDRLKTEEVEKINIEKVKERLSSLGYL